MLDKQTFQNKDLVLKVTENIDPKVFDISKYEAFLDILCGTREYQKEAIRISLAYLLSGAYKNLKDLAEENYHQNPVLQDKYGSFADFKKQLQLPDQLSASLDMATGTGKSYVLYGIARIMLAEGVIDQVLVLCPSITIEKGLTEKFKELSGKRDLRSLLPEDAKIKNPSIINASQTIKTGDICIENIHATRFNVKSAIEDSLTGKGSKTLVLNDEAHHIYSPADKDLKKWKEFLLNSKYGFYYIIGDTGTPYIGNDYFTDVIYRYSIHDAIEEKFIKTIDYVAEDSSGSEEEKFQKVHSNHTKNKKTYGKIKPITIIVTKDIKKCEALTERWIKFLEKREKISKETATRKVLIVTSSDKHKGNVLKLTSVDQKTNPTEWITSVSMLSEGWDVANVFQIVPHEERAFNSKLLIAQVLGRGLRIPQEYRGEQPVVTVFNHDKWSKSIKHLVDEILEIEKRINSYLVSRKSKLNFSLYNVSYEKAEESIEVPQVKGYELLKKGYVSFVSQQPTVAKETVYERAITRKHVTIKTIIEYASYTIEEVAHEIYNKLKVYDMDLGTSYSSQFPKKKLVQILGNSLKRIGEKKNRILEINKQKALSSVDVVRRKGAKYLRYRIKTANLYELKTSDIKKTSTGVGSFRRDSSLFYDDNSLKFSEPEDLRLLVELEKLFKDGQLQSASLQKVSNSYLFKTPVNVVFSASKPERDFLRRLVETENAEKIDSWIKSRDIGFYSIEYGWRKGEHWKIGKFNPDFFIKIGNDITVIELKEDDDINDENKAKLKYAQEHFKKINTLQKRQKYYFMFLSPSSYDDFFQAIRTDKKYQNFKSKIESDLES